MLSLVLGDLVIASALGAWVAWVALEDTVAMEVVMETIMEVVTNNRYINNNKSLLHVSVLLENYNSEGKLSRSWETKLLG